MRFDTRVFTQSDAKEDKLNRTCYRINASTFTINNKYFVDTVTKLYMSFLPPLPTGSFGHVQQIGQWYRSNEVESTAWYWKRHEN
jgi:hypothetical protein